MKTKLLQLLLVFGLLLLTCAPLLAAQQAQGKGATLYARTLLNQINLYRQENGLNPLRFDARLINLAKSHSFQMFRQKRISHNNFKQRFGRSGSHFCVENVGWNFTIPLKQFEAWHQSRVHDQNMLKKEISKVGIAEMGTYVTFFACK